MPCPVCGQADSRYLFRVRDLTIVRCRGCGLVSLANRENGATNTRAEPAKPSWAADETERQAAQQYVQILRDSGSRLDQLLLIAPEQHIFANEARQAGFQIAAHWPIGQLDNRQLESNAFNTCVVIYQLEQATDLARVMDRIWTALRPDGLLMIVTPHMDAWPAHFFGAHWTEWRPENHYYFSRELLQAFLLRTGFERVWSRPDRRHYTIEHVYQRAAAFPRTVITRLIIGLYRGVPAGWRSNQIALQSSGMIVTARRTTRRARPLVSIIMPLYNEAATFPIVMNALVAKSLTGADKEIIVVESNSRDGSRELARQYADQPEVRLIWQDRPRGKGHAVRAGLAVAQGDVIMIQDADLEYDINDYEALLEPILAGRALVVLGARHGQAWKMRQFIDQPGRAAFLNFGHVLFTTLLNGLYGGRLRDPFTMFKVFRRDCLYRLKLESNRFDFDFELISKLLRKGYRPLEIPVNYHSRSFREGKKVSLVRDPLTWIRALVKYRLQSPYQPDQ